MSFRELGVAYVVFWVYFNVPHLDTCHFDENPELSRRVEDSVLWCGAWVCSFVPQLAHKQLLLADASQWACCHSVQASRLDPRTRENCESQSDAGACVVWSISLCNCREHPQQITLWRAVGIACGHMFVCACTTTLALSRHLAQSRSAVQTT